jgi:hypothetical protein
MKHQKESGIRCALGIALVGAMFTTVEATAACYPTTSIPPGTPTYDAMFIDTKPTCPPVTPRVVAGNLVYEYALTMDEPASPASLVCGEFPGGNDCVAWPQGSNITYTWSATGGVTLDYLPSPHDYEVYLNCTSTGSGVGRVTVYAPGWGAAQNATSVAHCGNQ